MFSPISLFVKHLIQTTHCRAQGKYNIGVRVLSARSILPNLLWFDQVYVQVKIKENVLEVVVTILFRYSINILHSSLSISPISEFHEVLLKNYVWFNIPHKLNRTRIKSPWDVSQQDNIHINYALVEYQVTPRNPARKA